MNKSPEALHHETLQEATKSLFTGVTPERAAELDNLWNTYNAEFHILGDEGPDGRLVMEAGLYKHVRFNHRMMRLFWLSSFILWEAYVACHHHIETGETNLDRFKEILNCFDATLVSANVDCVRWPAEIPLPGELVDHQPGNPGRVAGELAVFSIGWAFLHEIRHLIHQNEGTSAQPEDLDARRNEELSCDRFATAFLLEELPVHAAQTQQDFALLQSQRQTGIYCALFALTLMTRGSWDKANTHPAIQDRVDNVVQAMREQSLSMEALAIAASAFITLKLVYPDAPSPLEATGVHAEIQERVRVDGW